MKQRPIIYLDVALMEEMVHRLAVSFFDKSDEPIPPFETVDRALLESSILQPEQSFDGQELYPTIADKSAVLFYGLVKNHPFKNGNKRIAVTATLIFLYLNSFWLKARQDAVYHQAMKVAKSKPGERDQVLASFARWLKRHVVRLSHPALMKRGRRRAIFFGAIASALASIFKWRVFSLRKSKGMK